MEQQSSGRSWATGTFAAIILAIGAAVFVAYSLVITNQINHSPTVSNPQPPVEASGRPATDSGTSGSNVPPATRPSR